MAHQSVCRGGFSICSPTPWVLNRESNDPGGWTGFGGGTFGALRCSRLCGGMLLGSLFRSGMKVSVGMVTQPRPARLTSTQAWTCWPFTTPSPGTTAPITTRAGYPSRLSASA